MGDAAGDSPGGEPQAASSGGEPRFAVSLSGTELERADNRLFSPVAAQKSRLSARSRDRGSCGGAARETGDFCPRLRPPRFAACLEARSYYSVSRTELFSVTDDCVGCGLCAKKCPVQAIEMRGRGRQARPVWTKANCAVCLGCMHRCPKHAIDYGKGRASARTRRHGQCKNPYARV